MKYRLIYAAIIPLCILGLVYIFMYKAGDMTGDQELEVTFGQDKSVKVRSTNNQIALSEVLNKIDENTPEFSAVQGTLEYFKFFRVKDLDIIGEISNIKPNESIATQYRTLAQRRKGPFQIPGQPIRVSTPGNIEMGVAAVCNNSDFFGESVWLFSDREDNGKTLQAIESIGECPLVNRKPNPKNPKSELIQINYDDAVYIFGREKVDSGMNWGRVMFAEPNPSITLPKS